MNIPKDIRELFEFTGSLKKNLYRKGLSLYLWRRAKCGKTLKVLLPLLCLDASPSYSVHGCSVLHALISRSDGRSWDSGGPEPEDIEDSIRLMVALAGIELMEMCDDDHGATALTWAAWYGRPRAMRTLLELGANPNALSAYGLTPLQTADQQNNALCVQIMSMWSPQPPSKKRKVFRVTPEDLRKDHADMLEKGARKQAAIDLGITSNAFREITKKELPGPARKVLAQYIMNLPEGWTAYTAPKI